MSSYGLSGSIAARFQSTQITPLLALVGLLLGVFALLVTPREEEPQINVTFANVFIPFPGASAREVESLVASPAEQVLDEIDGIEHVYSTSQPGMAILTVQFLVGEDRTDAIVRLYNRILSNEDWLPVGLGVGKPIIKPKGIDDVPIVTVTLWAEGPAQGAFELGQVAHAIEAELKRVEGTRDIYTVGAPEHVVAVELDPQALAARGLDPRDLRRALQAANSTRNDIRLLADDSELLVQAGAFLAQADEIADLVVGVQDSKPVFLRDVATLRTGPDVPKSYVWTGVGAGSNDLGLRAAIEAPAVTLAIAKKPGTNAVEVAQRVIERFDQLRGIYIPDGVGVQLTRNYGATADAKAHKLISKLVFATASVVLVVLLALGWREALIVGSAVVVTLAATLFASWAWGFTLNRVSLFALIFSIGILVDDAIVVVENIHRHLSMAGKQLREVIPAAVDEVGGPTILATFTVIAALLPMAFVSGLMGPYMSPIPINASLGMLISLVVAFVFTPWMSHRMLAPIAAKLANHGDQSATGGRLENFFDRLMSPFLLGRSGWRNRWLLLGGVLLLIGLSLLLVVNKAVVLKMLPFDNKSEFQVVLDMPEGTSLERTTQALSEIATYLAGVPEVTDYQVYSGTAAPISFNGLVRQYYLRNGAHLGDIQVNLVDAKQRARQSHEVALAVREPVQAIAKRHNGNAKIVEVPPGPPVLSPLVAEVYGPDYEGQIALAKTLRQTFEGTADIVDVDDSVEYPSEKAVLQVDRAKAARFGVSQKAIVEALAIALDGEDMSYVHAEHFKYAVPIRVRLHERDRSDLSAVLTLKVRSESGAMVPLTELVTIVPAVREFSIHHKDLLPVVYVTSDAAGLTDSPLYGMFDIWGVVKDEGATEQWLLSQPLNPYAYNIKWDGEWQVTYETFRDMGIAYSVGLLLIYLLVVAQFRSYIAPLIIMAPIPLTIIGILPGHAIVHWLSGAGQFTATSMIGMIALAGIIVRNSILLVDFINQEVRAGVAFDRAVVRSAAVRAKPIVLTGLAATAGAFFILDDPIFSGLAVSLIFGLFVSTVLTLVVIPVAYYGVMCKRQDQMRRLA